MSKIASVALGDDDHAVLAMTGIKHMLSTRTPSIAKKHVWSPATVGWPISPFPYGTIIRPTKDNPNFPPEHRQMVIGLAPPPNTESAICCVNLTDEVALNFYCHTIANIDQRWEEDS
jgi:hypothetical protein